MPLYFKIHTSSPPKSNSAQPVFDGRASSTLMFSMMANSVVGHCDGGC